MRTNDNEKLTEAFGLFERFIEGRLTKDEGQRLDELVAGDEDVRQAYVNYSHQHACLQWHSVPVSEADSRDFVESADANSGSESLVTASSTREAWLASEQTGSRNKATSWKYWLATVAACLAFLVGGFLLSRSEISNTSSQDFVATIVETKECAWGESSSPTALNSKLNRGMIHLISGLATLEFASGAIVTLEGPAKLDLVDPMNCVLHDGTLLANVPPRAKGFGVDTKDARLIDYGTSFGVVVNQEQGIADVQVFEGEVDLQHHNSRQKKRMRTGDRSIVDENQFDLVDAEADVVDGNENVAADPFENATIVTTRDGTGRQGYVRHSRPKSGLFEKRLILKTSTRKSAFDTKVYLGFDLAILKDRQVKRALLQLNLLPSARGYASFVPDATFAVYGLTDESLDDWQADSLTWENGPANQEGVIPVTSESVLLGRFAIPQGTESSLPTIDSSELAAFLNADTNGFATLLVIRETSEIQPRGLAHTFARGIPHAGVAPTLRILTK